MRLGRRSGCGWLPQYTRSSDSTRARAGEPGIRRRASLKRRTRAASPSVRSGMNAAASLSRSFPDATRCRLPLVSRRATAHPESSPMFSSTRPASFIGFSLLAKSLDTRFPRSSSSQYETVSGYDGGSTVPAPGGSIADLARSVVLVRISFALCGAPCGDDAHRTVTGNGRYNKQEHAVPRPAHEIAPIFDCRVDHVRPLTCERVINGVPRLLERNTVLGKVEPRLVRIPRRSPHGGRRYAARLNSQLSDNGPISGG